jgi:hypothetical protein
MSSFSSIAEQYDAHAAKQFRRAERQHRDPTLEELVGVLYYRAAGDAVRALINISDEELAHQTGREGFVMKTAEELAPITTGFAKETK